MKVCEKCGEENSGRDGENLCLACRRGKTKRVDAARKRRERDAVMRSLGLVKVRGALGGTYWE
jgi:uncharacterized membrane protein YvbJ